jgi:hypothetical protein
MEGAQTDTKDSGISPHKAIESLKLKSLHQLRKINRYFYYKDRVN